MAAGKMWASRRYSETRRAGATHIVATKLTESQYNALHYLAVEAHVSDYEYLRSLCETAIAKA